MSALGSLKASTLTQNRTLEGNNTRGGKIHRIECRKVGAKRRAHSGQASNKERPGGERGNIY